MRPMCRVSSSPMCFHVLPPSADLLTPLPHDELCRLLASPVPTHTTSGSDCETVTSPMLDTGCSSKTGFHVMPLLTVLKRPPDAVAAYTMLVLLSTTAKSSMRPPIFAGPISRNFRLLRASTLCAQAIPMKSTETDRY